MKVLPMIQTTRVTLPQSLNGKALILEPSCGVPQRRFLLGMLLALGLLLFLGNTAAADTVLNLPPTNQTVCAGSPAIFTVDASGDELAYQWRVSVDGGINFTNLSETETNASYTISLTTSADNGNQYQVIVSGTSGILTSAPPAVLTVVVVTGETIYRLPRTFGLSAAVENRPGSHRAHTVASP
jgi:hypothetical protein